MKSLLLNNQIFSNTYLQYKESYKATKNIYFIKKFNNKSFKSYCFRPKGYVFCNSIYNVNHMNFNMFNYLSKFVILSEQKITENFTNITRNQVEYLIKSKPNKIINLFSKNKLPKKVQKQKFLLVNCLSKKIYLVKKFIKRIIKFLVIEKKKIRNFVYRN